MESVYFYLHSVTLQDKVIKSLADYFKKIETQWFFIRYWHGGPHLRIRFKDEHGNRKAEVFHLLNQFATEIPNDSAVTAESYYKNQTFDGEQTNISELPWYVQGSLIEETYAPEINRYGSGILLELSERVFQLSSELVDSWLRKKNSFNMRILFSYYIFHEFLMLCPEVERGAFLNRYYHYWHSLNKMENLKLNLREVKKIYLPFLKKMTGSTEAKLFEEIREVLNKAKAIIDNEEMFLYLISSHIHMTNNRLSVTPGIEAEIAKSMTPEEMLVE
ncbi:thiopeptide-type bacteriocin biosynthesis protein [Enterococcus ureasiticus]|uniref:Thiopeptide-type bacteriocin biosynthesis domain-containing protein n=1 Tax=Enterococcus ureasiticus TaxID=903984 RepID=A0A1E5G8J5_9ENTE|nr:thiopeptide-type bacteriocin biosynthesis protein [Enterococcus ureasiticus]OEG09012.1 hypothetical protein BCR21_15670 [Enterococcus ureasiticus]